MQQIKSEDILSFLFKYPISKLSAAETAQVETLIIALNLHKPVLNASDIFLVGTRLLASSEDILSFLFKYPISKLSAAETAQVETLIIALNLHKPVLNASDIFLVGTRLLASVETLIIAINLDKPVLNASDIFVVGSRLLASTEDILSFLFKYPVSKLSATDTTQIEMLIVTLNLHKPVLNASDMFVVSTRLLASVFGTVVTYVLVALQFYSTRTKT
ncbi:hypothetical protein RN001_013888 [Aquatica leii]|uniref:Uncharacterized protein n=1 Tax=Aquatica leii TaxID=1421715 RepID=A0AAN7SLS9_9COLE|nr:hypothetical protein RN001_013888 [Aquatica leii]